MVPVNESKQSGAGCSSNDSAYSKHVTRKKLNKGSTRPAKVDKQPRGTDISASFVEDGTYMDMEVRKVDDDFLTDKEDSELDQGSSDSKDDGEETVKCCTWQQE